MTGVSLITCLAAICGIVAARYWLKVAISVDSVGDTAIRGHRRALSYAATATAGTLLLGAAAAMLALFAAG